MFKIQLPLLFMFISIGQCISAMEKKEKAITKTVELINRTKNQIKIKIDGEDKFLMPEGINVIRDANQETSLDFPEKAELRKDLIQFLFTKPEDAFTIEIEPDILPVVGSLLEKFTSEASKLKLTITPKPAGWRQPTSLEKPATKIISIGKIINNSKEEAYLLFFPLRANVSNKDWQEPEREKQGFIYDVLPFFAVDKAFFIKQNSTIDAQQHPQLQRIEIPASKEFEVRLKVATHSGIYTLPETNLTSITIDADGKVTSN